MDTGMPRPAADTPSDQEGFIIIEVLVSAIILALVAGAVLTLITATTRSAASQRDRATAYDLAQADQARLRTMQIPTLNNLDQLNEQLPSLHQKGTTLGGTTYNVESKAVFVNNRAGGVSCTAENDSADYIQLTSTVTSPALNSPVTIQSVVSPETGSLDPTHGTLAVEAENAAGQPISGVAVHLAGTAYGRTTETQGCANFADLPAGRYTVVYEAGPSLVNPNGETKETKEVVVSAGSTPERSFGKFDLPGTIEPEFVYVEPVTGVLRPAPVDSMLAVPQTGGSPRAFGKVGGERAAKLIGNTLYPFKGVNYTVYAGSCSSNNPNPTSTNPENNVGLWSVEVPPGTTLPPAGSKVQIHVPALELTVENGSKPVGGAKVVVTDENCKSGTGEGKRTFITNAAGHLSRAESGVTEAGLPFGTYKICASKKIGSTTLKAEVTKVSVENFTIAGTSKKLPLTTAGAECT
jgi:type II secretory pathway pseudopilin PulG